MKCDFPVKSPKGGLKPCNRKAVALYRASVKDYPRCKRHDSDQVRKDAERLGWVRGALVE